MTISELIFGIFAIFILFVGAGIAGTVVLSTRNSDVFGRTFTVVFAVCLYLLGVAGIVAVALIMADASNCF